MDDLEVGWVGLGWNSGGEGITKAGSHGLSPTPESYSCQQVQHGGKVPTFEDEGTIKNMLKYH